MSDIVQGVTETGEQAIAGKDGGGKAIRRLWEALSEDQQRALGLLTEGTPIREVGEKLGIHRGTIYRWLKSDPYFRAAYNAWQLEQQESCRAALMKAAEKAVARVIGALTVDQNLAWRVIKELGILSRPKPLLIDPERVEMEIALERHEEESVLMERIEQELKSDLPSPRGEFGRLLSVSHWGKIGRRQPRDPRALTEAGAGDSSEPGAEVSREAKI